MNAAKRSRAFLYITQDKVYLVEHIGVTATMSGAGLICAATTVWYILSGKRDADKAAA